MVGELAVAAQRVAESAQIAKLALVARDSGITELRRRGASWHEIAAAVGVPLMLVIFVLFRHRAGFKKMLAVGLALMISLGSIEALATNHHRRRRVPVRFPVAVATVTA